MAKKKDQKIASKPREKKAKSRKLSGAAKPAKKKASKPAAKKASKPAAKKPVKKKPVAKKAAKPAKKTNKPKPQVKKTVAKNKPSPKGSFGQKTKKAPVKTVKAKEVKKPAKDLKSKKVIASLSKEESKKAKPAAGDLEGEELDVEALELEPVEGAAADEEDELIEEVDVEEKPKKGRGRRRKKEGKKHYDSEDFVRKQIVKIDLSRPLIKKPKKEEPAPYVNNKDKRSRYSDKELAEFKEIILSKLQEAKIDYELLKQTLTNADNHGTDDTSPTFKLLEDGSDMLSKEEVAQLAARQEKYIVNLQNALVRIQNKTYGICRVTGKLIPKERLRSVPHATLSIDAKLSQYN